MKARIPDEIGLLLTAQLAGTASGEDRRRLAAWIAADPANAEAFAVEATVHAAMAGALQRRDALRARFAPPSGAWSRRVAIAAALAIVSSAALLAWRADRRKDAGAGRPFVAEAASVRWVTAGTTAGKPLPAGRVEIASGLMRVTLSGGNELIVRGPAEFDVGGSAVPLASGSYSFRATSELTVRAAGATLQARGAEFGVTLDGASAGRAAAFDGSVRGTWRSGQATALAAGGVPHTLEGDPIAGWRPTAGTFPREAELALATEAALGGEWARSRLELLADPHLLVYSNLSPTSSREAAYASGPMVPGTLRPSVDGQQISTLAGRSGSPVKAASFDRSVTALRARVDGDFTALTLAAWVKPQLEDARANRHRGLLMADGWGRPGLVHWQLKGGGFRLSFFDRGDGEDPRFSVTSDGLWDGGWHFLTTTISTRGPRPAVCHYLDGQLLSDVAVPAGSLASGLKLGNCSVGGWAPQAGDPDPDRHLNGGMADLMVFDRVMAPDEVKRLYDASAAQR